MRLLALLLSVVLTTGAAAAQTPAPTVPSVATDQPSGAAGPSAIKRIKKGLQTPSRERPLLESGLERTADFRIEVLEDAPFYEFLSKLEIKAGPAPAGGLYAYEQQRRLFSPTSRPLAQPYAAFSGGELITIALQNVLGRYLFDKIVNAASDRESRAAREEVAREILAFCGSRPDRARIAICNPSP